MAAAKATIIQRVVCVFSVFDALKSLILFSISKLMIEIRVPGGEARHAEYLYGNWYVLCTHRSTRPPAEENFPHVTEHLHFEVWLGAGVGDEALGLGVLSSSSTDSLNLVHLMQSRE
jgi:hypothetical protein